MRMEVIDQTGCKKNQLGHQRANQDIRKINNKVWGVATP